MSCQAAMIEDKHLSDCYGEGFDPELVSVGTNDAFGVSHGSDHPEKTPYNTI